MRWRLPLIALVCVLVLSVGCADSHERVMQDGIANMDRLATTLESIETVADAQAAADELKQIASRMAQLRERMDALGAPDPEDLAELKQKYEGEISEVLGRYMQTQFMIIKNPDIAAEVRKHMREMKEHPLSFF